jgi:Glycosyl hydrolase family 30 TIM-barrel domain
MQQRPHHLIVMSIVLLCSSGDGVFGQVECAAPGNLRGIRIDGELMAFSTSIRAVAPTAAEAEPGDRGRGGQFSREGDTLTMAGNLTDGTRRRVGPGGGRGRGDPPAAGASYRASFKDVAPGTVDAGIQITSNTNVTMQGVFFAVVLPGADYAGGAAQLIAPDSVAGRPVSLASADSVETNVYLRTPAKGVRVISKRRQIELLFPTPVELVVQDAGTNGNRNIEISFPLSLGNLTNGQMVRTAFTIKATGKVDKSPAKLAIDWSRPGRRFDGMGGNFRIQSPADAVQIQYNLDHLRVAWGRVAMPLDRWQPDEDAAPIGIATTNALNDNVRESMEMAQRLARKNIPMIISLWAAPNWALATNSGMRRGSARINPEKWDQVCQSIGSYLEYLKKNYGAEPGLFSFNESDMGVNVLQSPQEHADAIKRLGAFFASHGLKTRMLLGDTGNPTGDKFIDVALADTEATKYIGAVSFHSWNSGTVGQYTHFSEAARRLNVPLIVAEGGLDPAAWHYRNLFLEPWYCLDEIAQYVEICRVAQPLSILHWQFTADYSILTGGIDGQPFQPAQRFWNIKQLGMTAEDSTAVPATCDNPKVVSCAFADHGACVVHLVNNGAARKAAVSGLPAGVKEMRVFVTDSRRGLLETGRVPVVHGKVKLPLDAMSFTSLTSNP